MFRANMLCMHMNLGKFVTKIQGKVEGQAWLGNAQIKEKRFNFLTNKLKG
jgi:hypothetical protein